MDLTPPTDAILLRVRRLLQEMVDQLLTIAERMCNLAQDITPTSFREGRCQRQPISQALEDKNEGQKGSGEEAETERRPLPTPVQREENDASAPRGTPKDNPISEYLFE